MNPVRDQHIKASRIRFVYTGGVTGIISQNIDGNANVSYL